jgi:tripartite-type tricarboxylate transporter receptor subunit TctC
LTQTDNVLFVRFDVSRLPPLLDVPTLAEAAAGIETFVPQSFCPAAPRGTSAAIIARLDSALKAAL